MNTVVNAIVLDVQDSRLLVARNLNPKEFATIDFTNPDWSRHAFDLCYYNYYNTSKFNVGDSVKIVGNGIETRSLPPQVNAVRITRVKDSTISGTKDYMKVFGVVIEIEPSRVLIAKGMSKEEFDQFIVSKKSWFESGLNVTYYTTDKINDLKIGDEVQVKTNGVEAMSYPAQAMALDIEKVKKDS